MRVIVGMMRIIVGVDPRHRRVIVGLPHMWSGPGKGSLTLSAGRRPAGC
ncbi:MAG: hypothetical protein ACJ8BE_02075 [Microvirga sp.]